MQHLDRVEVQVGLARECGDHGGRIPEELLDGLEEVPDRAQETAHPAAARLVDGLGIEGVVPDLGLGLEVLQEIGIELPGLEDGLELALRDLADLLVGVEPPLLLRDALADLGHDLPHVDVLGLDLDTHLGTPSGVAAPWAV